jgi:cell wall-associated NlpC family hydrolase
MRTRRVLAAAVALLVALMAPGAAAPSRDELEAAQERLRALERDFQLVSERYNLVHERLTALQVEIARTEVDIDDLSTRMGSREKAAVSLARQLYIGGGSTLALEAVLSSDSFAEVETRLAYLRSSETAHVRVFERLATDRAQLQAEVERLEEAQDEVADAQAELSELRVTLENKVADQSDEVERLNAAIEAAERRAAARRAAARAAAAAAAAANIGATAEDVGAAPASNPRAQTAVDAALSQVGKPYQWGAAGPDSYDCSGLTMWAWGQAGISLPHNSGAQYETTARVPQSDWEPGDLLFFGSPIHHVGMYIGNGKMVEAPYSGQQVRVNSAYRSDYVGAGRPGV